MTIDSITDGFEELDDAPEPTPAPDYVRKSELRELFAEERRERAANGGVPVPFQYQVPKPAEPPTPEEQARADALASLERQKEHALLIEAAKAKLAEDPFRTEDDIARMTEIELLSESGIAPTPEQQRANELAAYNQRCLDDPVFFAAELEKKAQQHKAKQTAGLEHHARRIEQENQRQKEARGQ